MIKKIKLGLGLIILSSTLLTSCQKEEGKGLSESPIKTLVPQEAEQSIEMELDVDLGMNPVSETQSSSSKDEMRSLTANVSQALGGKITVKNTGNLKALLILKCEDASANVPYQYKVITCQPKDAGQKNFKFTGSPVKFSWAGAKTFEELKSRTWKAMFFYSKEIADTRAF